MTKTKTKLKADGQVREVPLGQLRSHERYVRTITPEKQAALARSLDEAPQMLWARPLIALVDGRVIAGNRKLEVLADAGREAAPTFVVELPDAEAEAWAIRDNRHFGEDDEPTLAALLQELSGQGVDLATIGFDPDEYEDLLAATDAIPELPPVEFKGGYAESDDELAERARKMKQEEPKREVKLLLKPDVHKKFVTRLAKLAKRYGTEGITATLLEAVRREADGK